ncbi:MAG: ATPase [Desulfobacca sp.]|uniref:ATPase n=1 Tax=Desulfobacca sp. TaxID=2067990 RepID=UPI0040499E4D
MAILKVPDMPRSQEHLESQNNPLEPEMMAAPVGPSRPRLPAARPPATIAEVGIPENFLANLLLKHAFYLEVFTLPDMTGRLKLNATLVMHLIDYLRREKYVEVKGSASLNGTATAISQNYRYALTEGGKRRAAQIFEFDTYMGPAPVTLEDYWQQVEGQGIREWRVQRRHLEEGFHDLIISEDLLERLGPAVGSGKPIFIYGPPGNGKTAIALRLGKIFGDTIMVPYALYVEGNIIRVFDEVTHRPAAQESTSWWKTDPRWVRCHRPSVLVGGEMTLEMLDLSFNPILRYYEAPLQLKANNGLFIVDDFGRQRIAPQELLNRWIIPMENRRDFLCLHTGQKFAIPFDQLLVFSTNLQPETLVDGAFLRRLRHKIRLDHINREQFHAIFQLVCQNYQVEYQPEVVEYLLETYYDPINRPMDACHPRDLVEQIIDWARYLDLPPELSRENLDRACRTYFVEEPEAG